MGRGRATAQPGTLLKARVREEELEDMIGAVGQTFLGLTVNCARCHDHKFDPIPQKDYYRLKAVFEGVRHGDRPILTPSETRAGEARAATAQSAQSASWKSKLAGIEQIGTGQVRRRGPAPRLRAMPVPHGRGGRSRWTPRTCRRRCTARCKAARWSRTAGSS